MNTPSSGPDPAAVDGLVDELGGVHIIGIGGDGMSGIARVLLARGVPVTGSDARESRRIVELRALGATVWVGHDAAHVPTTGAVAHSTAVKPGNPELRAARERGQRILRRAEILALLARGLPTVAVCGTHGKTTTTSMITVGMQACGVDPTFVIGSELAETGANAHLGRDAWFIVEADESDGTFLELPRRCGVVTNVEADHLDYWGSYEAVADAFTEFAAGIDPSGFLIACADDPGARRLIERAGRAGVDVRSYGTSGDADYRILDVVPGWPGWQFTLSGPADSGGQEAVPVTLRVPGVHNVRNAAAALAAGIGLGLPAPALAAGLAAFTGTRRRFEYRGTVNGVRVFDDYAHHPTEVAVTLTAARQLAGEGRVIVAFQPYRYYRTAHFIEDFAAALALADRVVVTEVYGPGEEPIPGASGVVVASRIPLPTAHVAFEASCAQMARWVAEWARPGDVVMTVGPSLGSLVSDTLARLAQPEP